MFRKLLHRLRSQLRRTKIEREMDAELRFHLEMETKENIRRGMSEEEAQRAARRSFGGVAQVKEAYRDLSRFRWIEDVWQDLRYGLRMLLKRPGFTLVAVVTLALGIGAVTSIFSVVNAILLRQLPYRDADRLVMVSTTLANGANDSFSLPEMRALREQVQTLEAVAGEHTRSVNLTGTEQPDRVRGGYVTANYFDVFQIAPLIGRTFAREEERPGAARVAVVREGFWRDRMNGDPHPAGKKLILDGETYEVIGVVPASFRSPQDPDAEVWMTAQYFPGNVAAQGFRYLYCHAYLKPGVSLAQTRAEIKTIAERWAQAYPKENAGRGADLELLHELSGRGIRRPLLVLAAAVGFVLLIACANLANLMLSRGAARVKELSMRSALGASRWRLVRQLLTESVLLSLCGGASGLLIASWSLGPLLQLSPGIIPYGEANLDRRVLLFTLAVSVLTGVLAGLAPALQFGSPDLKTAFKDGGRTSGEGMGLRWARSTFVVLQVALSFTLLIGTIIGIVGDTKHRWLSERQEPQLYTSYSQMPGAFATVVARTSVEPLGLANAVRQAVWKVDRDQPMWKIRTVEFLMNLNVGDQRFMLVLMCILATLALVIASVGLYGVMSYAVVQRTREMGIRLALGARPGALLKMVIGQGMRMALLGLVIGLLASLALTRVMERGLFEVSVTDKPTFVVIALLLAAVAALACYVPARRATKVDPIVALQCE